jgi:hypothetical protein
VSHKRGGGTHHQLLLVGLQGTLHLHVRPELGGAVGPDLELARGSLLHLLGEEAHGAALVAVLLQAVAEANLARLETSLGHCGRRRGKE